MVASSIGDRVWLDTNANGIQDDGEPGVAGFPVTLTGTDVDGNTVQRTTTTDSDGKYLFDGLASGTYTVAFDPAGLPDSYHSFTIQHAGADGSVDSDGDPTTGIAGPIALGVDTADLAVDQGIVDTTPSPGSITLSKTIVDPDPTDDEGDAATFPVTVACTGPQDLPEVVRDVELPRDGTPVVIDGIVQGAVCTIEETDTDGGTATYSARTVTVGAEPVVVTVTNTFPDKAIEPSPPVSPEPTPPPAASAPLAWTGASVVTISIIAVLLLGAGGLLIVLGTRRRRGSRT